MRETSLEGNSRGLNGRQQAVKRLFDLCIAVPGFFLTLPVIVLSVAVSSIDTREWGIFSQERIGRDGRIFKVHKIRSMRTSKTNTTTVTTTSDPRITRFGAFIRRTKIDELTQLWDVIIGKMSIVGPRPDVAGWADALEGSDQLVLTVRPGVTGPASIAFRNEEKLLAAVDDPVRYNREIIWPEKVRINKRYIETWTIRQDLVAIMQTAGLIK